MSIIVRLCLQVPNGAADYVKFIQEIFTGNSLQAATILFILFYCCQNGFSFFRAYG